MNRSETLRQDVKTISLVALAHGLSHFVQISTAVVFPLIKGDLGVSYVALGGTVALYYVVSGVCQTAAGFAVDRYGARRVLFFGLALSTGGVLMAGFAHIYAMLVAAAIVGGIGNSVFHPCDFSILNARVRKERLGYAFSGHGIAGYLGYAAAPAYGIAMAAATGFATGMTNPSRDLIVRATTPPGATGKVYGFVYSGLDVGSMMTPVFFGWLLDVGRPGLVFYSVVVSALLTIATVLNLPGSRAAAKA